VLGNRCQRGIFESAGASFGAYRHAPDNEARGAETDILRDWEARTPIGAFARVRDHLIYGPAALFARDVLDVLDTTPSEVICWDYLLAGAGLAAERSGIGSAAIVHTVYPLPADGVPPFGQGLMPAKGPAGRVRDAALAALFQLSFRPGLKAINQARAELGIPAQREPFDQLARADRILVMTSPEFDFAGPETVPANVRFVGPALPAPAAWQSPWPADDERPLVIVSFSTTYMDQRTLMERALLALADLPVKGLVTTGPAIDASGLRPPKNVVIRDFVAHADVLPHAAAVVTHGGMGTVHAALAAGVPLICIPHGRDQHDVTARVVYRGAGVRLPPRAGPQRLARAIRDVISNSSYAAAAAGLASALAPGDGGERAADELEQLANQPNR
jgi:UDP:flavonoid glycosyltransferase YjiC (YdhE family)